MQLSANYKLLITVALASLMASLLAAPSQASTSDDDRTVILLPRASQPAPPRPILDGIKRSAKQKNTTLAEAIDAYAAQKVAADPSVTARAMQDGLDPAAVEPEIKIDDLWLSELNDLKIASRSMKITLEEAIETIAWQPRLNEVGTKLVEHYPAELSGLVVLEDGRKAQIGFKGEIPKDAIELAKTLPVAVELVGNKGFSEKDLEQARDTAYAHVNSRRDLVETLSGSYDIETGTVTITVKPRAMPGNAIAQQAVVTQLQPAQPTNRKISVRLNLTGNDLVTPLDNWMRGGGDFSGCTTGFNVININNTASRRTTSAAHCGGESRIYCNHPAQGSCTWSDVASRSSTYDISSWTRGGLDLTRTFYYDFERPRYVYYLGTSPAIGQNICNFGITTGEAKCANITQTNVTYPNARGVIIMDRNINKGGDSGGPWYKGNTAWGILLGLCGNNSCFSPAYLIPSAVGASWELWTAPPGT